MSKSRILAGLIGATGVLHAAPPPLNLPVKQLNVCGRVYSAWVATSDADRERGLMNFRPLRPHEAMLFVFNEAEPRAFWMKNVPYDLDIAFFDEKKTLVSQTTMKGTSPITAESALPSYPSRGLAQYAVEVAGAGFRKLPRGCRLKIK